MWGTLSGCLRSKPATNPATQVRVFSLKKFPKRIPAPDKSKFEKSFEKVLTKWEKGVIICKVFCFTPDFLRKYGIARAIGYV